MPRSPLSAALAAVLLIGIACKTEGQADAPPALGAKAPAEPAAEAPPTEPTLAKAAATPQPEPAEPEPKPTEPDTSPDTKDDANPADAKADPAAEAKAEAKTDTDADGATEAKADPAAKPTKHKVLILGDSLAATGFGALLERQLDEHPQVVCYRKGKSASGLARPDFFDWLKEAKRQVELREPELVIVIMGGNDGQDLTPIRRGKRKTKRVLWKADGWKAEYRTRMDDFLGEVTGPGRKVLWLGLPTMGLRSLERKLETIRAIQRAAVEALGGGSTYLDTAPFVTNDAGELLTHARIGNRRKPQKIRADDRIHFTMSGSKYFAEKVYPSVLDALGLSEAPADG